MPFTKEDIVLATMAAGGEGARFEPVQIQKILFLIDEKVSRSVQSVGGPHFNFQPYDYGPFDRDVYRVLDSLSDKGEVSTAPVRWYCDYGLTSQGYEKGQKNLDLLGDRAKKEIGKVVEWASRVSFDELVSTIYQQYPKMKKRSVFRA